MGTIETVFVYLLLVRLITAFLFVTFYINNKNKASFILMIAGSIYALAAALRIFISYSPYIGLFAGIFAVLGLGLIMASVLNYVYDLSLKKLLILCGVVCICIIIINIFNYEVSGFIIYLLQALILLTGLIAVVKKRKRFREILGFNSYWLYGSLIAGNLVIGVYILNVLFDFKMDYWAYLLTFLTSLMLAMFFIQYEYIAQNRLIKKANMELIEEAAMQEKVENKQKALIANISDVISIIDKNGIIKYISPNIEKWFGWSQEEMIGKNGFELIHPDNFEYTREDLSKFVENINVAATIEVEYKCKDGKYKYVKMTALNLMNDMNINGILLNYHDISERKRLEKDKLMLEAYMRNQQKLESIGTLAGGVAHEINNPINGIMNYAQLILDMPKINSETSEYLQEIIVETERISEIVKNLLQFSRHDKHKHSYAKPEDIINQTVSLIRTIIKHDQITLLVDIPKGLPGIKCRSQQIQQVVMNMLTNARDALNRRYPEYNEDKICKLYCKQYSKDDRKWIRITVEDHGNGIKKDIQDKIFEPFFTTKGRDRGTGLGLSISYGIVKDHHGELSFDTEEGKYTKFHLDLPVDNGWELQSK